VILTSQAEVSASSDFRCTAGVFARVAANRGYSSRWHDRLGTPLGSGSIATSSAIEPRRRLPSPFPRSRVRALPPRPRLLPLH